MKITHEQQRQQLLRKIESLQQRKFYGTVTLDIQGGNLLRWTTKWSEKLTEEVNHGDSRSEGQASGRADQVPAAEAEQADQTVQETQEAERA